MIKRGQRRGKIMRMGNEEIGKEWKVEKEK